jgi:hypothetical protein
MTALSVTVPLTALAKGAETMGFRDPVTVPLTRAVDLLDEQLAVANARADRAEQRVVDKDAAIDHLRGRLDQLMTLLADRRPWWRRWVR